MDLYTGISLTKVQRMTKEELIKLVIDLREENILLKKTLRDISLLTYNANGIQKKMHTTKMKKQISILREN